MEDAPYGDLPCPSCAARQSHVIDTRGSRSGAYIRRRRVCQTCQHRFTTREVLRDTNRGGDLEVTKKLKAIAQLLTEIQAEINP